MQLKNISIPKEKETFYPKGSIKAYLLRLTKLALQGIAVRLDDNIKHKYGVLSINGLANLMNTSKDEIQNLFSEYFEFFDDNMRFLGDSAGLKTYLSNLEESNVLSKKLIDYIYHNSHEGYTWDEIKIKTLIETSFDPRKEVSKLLQDIKNRDISWQDALNSLAENCAKWFNLSRISIFETNKKRDRLIFKTAAADDRLYDPKFLKWMVFVAKSFGISNINLKQRPKCIIIIQADSKDPYAYYITEDIDNPLFPVNKYVGKNFSELTDARSAAGFPVFNDNDELEGYLFFGLEKEEIPFVQFSLLTIHNFRRLAGKIISMKKGMHVSEESIIEIIHDLENSKRIEQQKVLDYLFSKYELSEKELKYKQQQLLLKEEQLTEKEKALEKRTLELFSTQNELSKEKQEKEKFSKELDILRDDIKNNLEVGGVLHDTINNFDRIKSLSNRINRALVENPNDPELLELAKKLNTLIQEAMITIVVSQNELKGKKTKDTVFYSLSKTHGKVARKYEREYLVPYNISFEITPNEEADMIPLGVVMLSRFIENLFLNSFRILANHETTEQKKILIYSEEKSLKIGKEAREPQKYIVVHFVDNGPGITNERKEKIFQQGGDSTKEDKQGEHGVALPYMRKKMKEIGGYVREVGVPGEGAHFELFFPKLSPAELKEEARKNPGEARLTHDLRNAKILILDDHSEILDKYISIYSKFGSDLRTGLNGKEGLDILDSGFIPDFIQSDIEMNIMRGEDFIKEVRQRGHKMPIMVITGNEEYIDENTGDLNEDKGMDLLEIGVNDIIIRDKAEEKIILEKAQNLLVRYLFKN